MSEVLVGLSALADDAFRLAAAPLFDEGDVDALEWSFDTADPPDWLAGLLDFCSAEGRLWGHGVSYSPLSAGFSAHQARWLERLADETSRRTYQGFSEHFGVSRAQGWRQAPPLPVPWTPTSEAVGIDRMQRFSEAAGVPVGLENLALAFGMRDVLDQGAFLDALLEPVDGYLHLDLHNLWCQCVNFDVAPGTLLSRYPLDRVRVVHVAGGSWSMAGGSPFRRDTHDGPVPQEVLDLLRLTLQICSGLQVVFLERLRPDPAALRADLRAVREVVDDT